MLRLLDLSSLTSNLKVNIPKSCFSLVVTIALATNLVDNIHPRERLAWLEEASLDHVYCGSCAFLGLNLLST